MWYQLDPDLLQIEYVSVVGLLLAVCGYLIYTIKNKDQQIKELRDEIKEKDVMLVGFVEKYYTIATRINERLK